MFFAPSTITSLNIHRGAEEVWLVELPQLKGSYKRAIFLKGWGGRAAAQNFWKIDFELWVGGHGQDMYQQLEGGFGPINPMLPMWGLGAKS